MRIRVRVTKYLCLEMFMLNEECVNMEGTHTQKKIVRNPSLNYPTLNINNKKIDKYIKKSTHKFISFSLRYVLIDGVSGK